MCLLSSGSVPWSTDVLQYSTGTLYTVVRVTETKDNWYFNNWSLKMNQTISITIPSNILTTNLYINEIYPDCDTKDISVTLNVTQIQQLLTLLEPLASKNEHVDTLINQIFD